MKIHLLLLFTLAFFNPTFGQTDWWRQYFDGADTVSNSISIQIDADSTNIWQIGKPQKSIFDSAATQPNVLITDTINSYPNNNTSRFQFTIVPWSSWGILAIQWKQKLDMDKKHDGGIIQISTDGGLNWGNAFINSLTYNFYGFDPANQDTLDSGMIGFSGTDSTWRDIWLCFDMSWGAQFDSLLLRFTFVSDSVDNNKEGWMIDNLMSHLTIIHTVSTIKQENYLHVYPNPANDIIHIETQKLQEFHIIEQMTLVNSSGQVVDEWKNVPTKFFINTRNYSNGSYQLKIQTNIKSEIVPIVINRN